ncbi:hypothetical protein HQ544_02065 [Candidatus Falkowbacteria bacterium]|nr:hypothetical protein [Candidatus Falkowbacteria bacterium]
MKTKKIKKHDKNKFIIFFTLFVSLFCLALLAGCSFLEPSSCEPMVLGFEFDFLGSDGIIDYGKSKVDYTVSVWENQDSSSWVDERDITVWESKQSIYKESITLWIKQQYASCDLGDSYIYLDSKKVKILIDGKKYYSDPDSGVLDVKYSILHEGKEKSSLKIEMDYKGQFKTVRNVEVNWLNSEEFEAFRAERDGLEEADEEVEEGSGDEEEEVIDETG